MRHPHLIALACAVAVAWSALAQAAQLTLNWKDNANNESGFLIERKAGTCRDGKGAWRVVARLPANAVGYVDDHLTAGATYCYRINAFNAGGASAWSNQAEGIAKNRPSAQASRH